MILSLEKYRSRKLLATVSPDPAGRVSRPTRRRLPGTAAAVFPGGAPAGPAAAGGAPRLSGRPEPGTFTAPAATNRPATVRYQQLTNDGTAGRAPRLISDNAVHALVGGDTPSRRRSPSRTWWTGGLLVVRAGDSRYRAEGRLPVVKLVPQ